MSPRNKTRNEFMSFREDLFSPRPLDRLHSHLQTENKTLWKNINPFHHSISQPAKPSISNKFNVKLFVV